MRRALTELERAASILRRQIQAAEDKDKRAQRLDGHFKSLRAAGQAAVALERDGISAELAALRVARIAALPVESVAHWAKVARRDRTAGGRAERDREALRLARLGHQNAVIAKRLGICERTVTRIIARAFRGAP